MGGQAAVGFAFGEIKPWAFLKVKACAAVVSRRGHPTQPGRFHPDECFKGGTIPRTNITSTGGAAGCYGRASKSITVAPSLLLQWYAGRFAEALASNNPPGTALGTNDARLLSMEPGSNYVISEGRA